LFDFVLLKLANAHIVLLFDAVFTVTMVATVELGSVQTLQKLVSAATIAVSVVASQLVAHIAGGDRSFWYDSSLSIPVYRPTCFRIRHNPLRAECRPAFPMCRGESHHCRQWKRSKFLKMFGEPGSPTVVKSNAGESQPGGSFLKLQPGVQSE
jgi:hypothetical protein